MANLPERTGAAGLALIKHYEGFFPKPYYCPAKVLTIGYGHTNLSGVPPKVKPGLVMTEAEASELLSGVLARVYEPAVRKYVKVDLNQNQFDALVSFTYNCGAGALERSSALRHVNAKNFRAVPAALALWNKGGGRVLLGLVRRRKSEGDLFMKPDVFSAFSTPVSLLGKPGPKMAHIVEEGAGFRDAATAAAYRLIA